MVKPIMIRSTDAYIRFITPQRVDKWLLGNYLYPCIDSLLHFSAFSFFYPIDYNYLSVSYLIIISNATEWHFYQNVSERMLPFSDLKYSEKNIN